MRFLYLSHTIRNMGEAQFIDKIAYLKIENRKLLVTLSKGKDVWYIPGGKRDNQETDEEALIREVREELAVDIIPESVRFYGEFRAQAHGKPEGVMVRMRCYLADYRGFLNPSAEIEKMDWFVSDQKNYTSPVDHLIFDDLKSRNLID